MNPYKKPEFDALPQKESLQNSKKKLQYTTPVQELDTQRREKFVGRSTSRGSQGSPDTKRFLISTKKNPEFTDEVDEICLKFKITQKYLKKRIEGIVQKLNMGLTSNQKEDLQKELTHLTRTLN